MVAPKHRSRGRYRQVKVKLAKGNTTHYRLKNRSVEKCAVCKKPLRGMKRLTRTKYKNLNKSQKKVERPFGGYMCHKCLAQKLFEEKVQNNL